MKIFGKLTATSATFPQPPLPIGINEEGEIVYGPERTVNVLIFRDAAGVDIVDAAKTDPHPFYIAVDDDGRVFSMTNDIEHSQIDGYEIIGIDEDNGYSFGPGGTVYGKIWNGTAIVEAQPEPDAIPNEISRRQFFQYLAVLQILTRQEALAALQNGAIPAPLQAIIDQLPTEDDRFEAQMFILGAQNFNRQHPLSETVRLALNWTLEQKDDFWCEAFKI
ncbi:hypothetical protein ABE530_18255 [Brucella sp. TWI559]